MKKLLTKLRKSPSSQPPERITNDTVSEHRRRVLEGGRKFKYPLQYSRHKLVINTVIISILALIVVGVFGWWQLYPQQNTSAFTYRVTSAIPLPVAKVDDSYVRYSDYLMKFRSAEHYLQQKEQSVLNGEDSQRQRDYLKRQSLRDVIADTYAVNLAEKNDVTVSDEELENFLASQRRIDGGEITERTHYAVIQDYYDWSPSEYGHVMKIKLLREKVAYAIDESARELTKQVGSLLAAADQKESWKKVIEKQLESDQSSKVTAGVSGMVPKTNQDGGLAAAVANLKRGEVAGPIKSSVEDGYHYAFVKLIDSNSTQVNYEFVTIAVTELSSQIEKLYKDGAVQVFIGVPLEGKES